MWRYVILEQSNLDDLVDELAFPMFVDYSHSWNDTSLFGEAEIVRVAACRDAHGVDWVGAISTEDDTLVLGAPVQDLELFISMLRNAAEVTKTWRKDA